MNDIGEILNTYLHAPNFQSAKKLIEVHPTLLAEETDVLLSNWITEAMNRENIGRVNALKSYQAQLRLFKSQGIDQTVGFYDFGKRFTDIESITSLSNAFVDFTAREDWEERKRTIDLHPELLAPTARELLELDLDRILEEYPIVALKIRSGLFYLDLCRELGVAGAKEWMESQVDEERGALASSFLESPIFPSVASFLLSRSWDTAKRIIEQHPELLTSEVDPIIEGLMESAHKNESWERLFMLAFYHTVLKDCRSRTVDIVFDELETQPHDLEQFLSALEKLASASPQDQQAIIEQDTILLSPFTDTILEIICVQLDSKPELRRHYKEWQLMLRYCHEMGIEKVFEFFSPENRQKLLLIFAELLKSENWGEVKTVVEANPLLLSPVVDLSIYSLMGTINRSGVRELDERFEQYRLLLRKCQEVGIDLAIEQMKLQGELTPLPDLSAPINSNLQRKIELIAQFINTENWLEGRAVLEQNPELLSEGIDFAFGQIIEYFEDQDEERAASIRRHWDVIRQCREIGIEKTFEVLLNQS